MPLFYFWAALVIMLILDETLANPGETEATGHPTSRAMRKPRCLHRGEPCTSIAWLE
jgi:hypothetical protein